MLTPLVAKLDEINRLEIQQSKTRAPAQTSGGQEPSPGRLTGLELYNGLKKSNYVETH